MWPATLNRIHKYWLYFELRQSSYVTNTLKIKFLGHDSCFPTYCIQKYHSCGNESPVCNTETSTIFHGHSTCSSYTTSSDLCFNLVGRCARETRWEGMNTSWPHPHTTTSRPPLISVTGGFPHIQQLMLDADYSTLHHLWISKTVHKVAFISPDSIQQYIMMATALFRWNYGMIWWAMNCTRCERKQQWHTLRPYPGMSWEGGGGGELRNTTDNLKLNIRFPGRDVNPDHSKY